MGSLSRALHLVRAASEPVEPQQRLEVGPASPWTDAEQSQLSTVVWADLLDKRDLLPMTRAEAISVPAIAKARHVVCPKVAGYPLRVLRGDTEVTPAPSWITRTDDGVSPWHRMLWTVDDLIFSGWSLWIANRGAGNPGPLLSAARIRRERWHFNDEWQVIVDDSETPLPADKAILIPGPHEGICTMGRRTVRHARDLLDATENAGRNPSPTFELHYTGDAELTDPEIDEMLDVWIKARQGDRAGVGYTNKNVETKEHKSIESSLLVEGRNAAAVDCARVVGVAAAMVDATVVKASLTYETTEGRGLEHTEYGVEPYAEAIAARLSLDDIVPRGQRARFDLGADVGPVQTTGPTEED